MKWSGHKLEWDASILYTEDSSLDRFKATTLTSRMIMEWYEWRTRAVTKKTSIPELGLELLQKVSFFCLFYCVYRYFLLILRSHVIIKESIDVKIVDFSVRYIFLYAVSIHY